MKASSLVTIIVSLVLIGGFAGFYFGYQKGGHATTSAPDYELDLLSGQQLNISSFRPNVTLLDFMSVTCIPCKAMYPILSDLLTEPELMHNLSIISLEIDSTTTRQQLIDYAADHNITWDVAFSPAGMKDAYDVTATPTFVIINSEGQITFHQDGTVSKDVLKDVLVKTLNHEVGATKITTHSGFAIGMAIVTGIASFLSPCAFPLLPSYLAHIFGQKSAKAKENKEINTENEEEKEGREEEKKKKENHVLFYSLVGGLGGIGILLSYILLGLLIVVLGSSIKKYVPFLNPIIGGILILLGIALFANLSINFSRIQQWITKRRVQVTNKTKSEKSKQIWGTFLYGIGYGLASLGCNAPIFFAFALQISTEQIWKIILAFAAFALTIIVLMILTTVLISFSRDALINKLKNATETIERISGVIIILVGIYLLLEFFNIL